MKYKANRNINIIHNGKNYELKKDDIIELDKKYNIEGLSEYVKEIIPKIETEIKTEDIPKIEIVDNKSNIVKTKKTKRGWYKPLYL